jgi:fatty-acyl-CoA synthase
MSPDEMYRLMCTAGQPMAGVEVRVVNETGKDVPADGHASGEVWLRSDTVMVGYWNRPDATISAIQDGWLRTGDIGTITPDGFLDIVDRMKDVIVSGGENISSIEIENALYEHPAVLECAIIAIPDDYWGERPLALWFQRRVTPSMMRYSGNGARPASRDSRFPRRSAP